jgi:putative transposase
LTRYVVLNPVRAGIVDAPEQWPWSSHRAMIGEAPPPSWLAVDGLLSQFGPSREEARRRYRSFVHEGVGESIWQGLRQQIYLGDEAFVTRMQRNAQTAGDTLSVPQAQRRPPAPTLGQIARDCGERNAAMVTADATGAYTYRDVAEHFGVHLATVGRLVRRGMQQCEK